MQPGSANPEDRDGRFALIFAGACVAILLVIFFVIALYANNDLKYVVTFKDARGLRPGDLVAMNGVNIGKVDSIELGAQGEQIRIIVRIDNESREQVRANSTAVISSADYPDITGVKFLDLHNSIKPSPAMPPNAVVRGKEGGVQLKAWQLREKGSVVLQRLKASTAELREKAAAVAEIAKEKGLELNEKFSEEMGKSIRKFAEDIAPRIAEELDREQIAALAGRVAELLRSAGEAGAENIDGLVHEWAEIRREAGPIINKLLEIGEGTLAESLLVVLRSVERRIRYLAYTFGLGPYIDELLGPRLFADDFIDRLFNPEGTGGAESGADGSTQPGDLDHEKPEPEEVSIDI